MLNVNCFSRSIICINNALLALIVLFFKLFRYVLVILCYHYRSQNRLPRLVYGFYYPFRSRVLWAWLWVIFIIFIARHVDRLWFLLGCLWNLKSRVLESCLHLVTGCVKVLMAIETFRSMKIQFFWVIIYIVMIGKYFLWHSKHTKIFLFHSLCSKNISACFLIYLVL